MPLRSCLPACILAALFWPSSGFSGEAEPQPSLSVSKLQVRQNKDGGQVGNWNLTAWYGSPKSRFGLQSAGNYSLADDAIDSSFMRLKWQGKINDKLTYRAGAKYITQPKGKIYSNFGLSADGPYKLGLDYDMYISNQAQITHTFEASRIWKLSGRFDIEGHGELDFSSRDMPDLYTGKGLTNASARLRLRYEMPGFLAPYIGIDANTAAGNTKDMLETAGFDPSDVGIAIGFRSWQ